MTRAAQRLKAIPCSHALWAIVAIACVLVLANVMRAAKHRQPRPATPVVLKADREPLRPRAVVPCVSQNSASFDAGYWDIACVDDTLRVMRNRPDGWVNQTVTFEGQYLGASFLDDRGESDVPAEADVPLPPARIR